MQVTCGCDRVLALLRKDIKNTRPQSNGNPTTQSKNRNSSSRRKNILPKSICVLPHRRRNLGRSILAFPRIFSIGKPRMIKMQINELLGERSHYWLSKTTQVEYSVIRNLASQKSQRISYAAIEKLCVALKCEPGDLFVRAPKSRRT